MSALVVPLSARYPRPYRQKRVTQEELAMSRNVWRRLFAYGVLEATDGSPSDADGFSWTEAALALFVLGGAGTILSLLTQRAVPWDLPCEPTARDPGAL